MSKNIIIVDRDYDSLELFGEFFQQQGFNAIKISNIKDLLLFVESHQTDIIVSDPDFLIDEDNNYFDFVIKKLNKIPILYLTEKNKMKILENKMKIQKNHMIEKPVSFINLLEFVNQELKY